jgi:hypothetical protein
MGFQALQRSLLISDRQRRTSGNQILSGLRCEINEMFVVAAMCKGVLAPKSRAWVVNEVDEVMIDDRDDSHLRVS